MVRVAGNRWYIEYAFTVAKQKVGLDDYDVRNATGRKRHMIANPVGVGTAQCGADGSPVPVLHATKGVPARTVGLLQAVPVPEMRRLLWRLILQVPAKVPRTAHTHISFLGLSQLEIEG